MILSDPPSDVAKGCVVGYLADFVKNRLLIQARKGVLQKISFDGIVLNVHDTDEAESRRRTRWRQQEGAVRRVVSVRSICFVIATI